MPVCAQCRPVHRLPHPADGRAAAGAVSWAGSRGNSERWREGQSAPSSLSERVLASWFYGLLGAERIGRESVLALAACLGHTVCMASHDTASSCSECPCGADTGWCTVLSCSL